MRDTPLSRSSLIQQLSDLLGADVVLPVDGYAVDGALPQAVVQPARREVISEVLAWASEENLSVIPWGGGTQLDLGNKPDRVDVVLDLSRYDRLLDHQPADLTATVEAGMSLARFQRELAAQGKMVPLESPLAQQATIGGILAANSTGPLRHSYGLPRDWLIGISVIGPDGTETKAGGRVVKNVTGYDLNKLYAGSLGTLGVIVEATFKLAPAPSEYGGLVAPFSSMASAIGAARSLLGQVFAPQGVQVVNYEAASGLGLGDLAGSDGAVLLGFTAGRSRAVRRRLEDSAKLLRQMGSSRVDYIDSAGTLGLLEKLTDLGWDGNPSPALGVTLNVPPAETLAAVEWPRQAGIFSPAAGIVADPGFGRVDLLVWDAAEMVESVGKLRRLAAENGGSAVVRRCPLAVKEEIDVWGAGAGEVELMRRLKFALDPKGILNPGRGMGKI